MPDKFYTKYKFKNPVARWLISNFVSSGEKLLEGKSIGSALEVGCGQGYLLRRLFVPNAGAVLGADIDADFLRRCRELGHGQRLVCASVERLPFADQSFDLVAGMEILEHLPDPGLALSELARVSRRYVLVSVPREPLWRILNMARGAYLGDFGNTEGHVHHWTAKAFLGLCRNHFRVLGTRYPLPWTLVLGERFENARPKPAATAKKGATGTRRRA